MIEEELSQSGDAVIYHSAGSLGSSLSPIIIRSLLINFAADCNASHRRDINGHVFVHQSRKVPKDCHSLRLISHAFLQDFDKTIVS